MGVLDNTCYYSFAITDNRTETSFKNIRHNLNLIKALLTELDKFPLMAKEEFISIFSKNTIQLAPRKPLVSGQERRTIESLVEGVFEADPKLSKEPKSIMYLRVDVGEFTTGTVVVLDSVPEDVVLAI